MSRDVIAEFFLYLDIKVSNQA